MRLRRTTVLCAACLCLLCCAAASAQDKEVSQLVEHLRDKSPLARLGVTLALGEMGAKAKAAVP
jgi:hypothetical protein